jgi:hypothetical protein
MNPTAAHRRRLIPVIALLLVLDSALLVGWVVHRQTPAHAERWEIDPSDPRVVRVFSALGRDGLPGALDSLERSASRDSAVLRGAHQLAHALGRQAVLKSGGDPALLIQCRPIFASGCYHGVIEALLGLRKQVDTTELRHLCATAGRSERPGAVYECAHGLGHGVLSAVDLDPDEALGYCDTLGRPLASACHEGVFMEAITSALARPETHAGHSAGSHAPHAKRLSVDRENPYSPCDRYADPYGHACWLFQGFLILRNVDFDASSALRLCAAAPGGRTGRCAEGVGHQLAGLFQRNDAWLIQQCGKGNPETAAQCAAGAALALVQMDWSGGRVNRYCASVPSSWRETCFATASETLAKGSL